MPFMVQTKHPAPQTKTLICPYMPFMVQTKHTVLQTKAYMPYNLSRILHRDGSKHTHRISKN